MIECHTQQIGLQLHRGRDHIAWRGRAIKCDSRALSNRRVHGGASISDSLLSPITAIGGSEEAGGGDGGFSGGAGGSSGDAGGTHFDLR
jgi:hypothetical protein